MGPDPKAIINRSKISFGLEMRQTNPPREKLMNSPTSEAADEKTLPVELAAEAEISKLAKTESSKLSTPIETNSERIRSSVARSTSNSIDELRGLISELQKMQQFLESEVDRVQHQIESALAGINIIVETIAPWQSTEVSKVPPTTARAVRAGPAANIEAACRVGAGEGNGTGHR
jgi:hypothetical protein